MKKGLLVITCLLLMFASNYDVSINIEETATVQDAENIENSEDRNGSNTFILNESGDIVELVEDFDYSKSVQALMMQEELKKIKYDFHKTYEINNDMRAWVYMKDYLYSAVADIPENFTKYFRSDLYGNFDWSGIPFMSKTSMSTFKGNALIYGHNMDNGSAFGKIRHLADQENFTEVAPLIIYDGKEDVFKIYKAYAVFHVEDGIEFINLKNFDSESQRQNYNKSLLDRSSVKLEDGWNIDWSKDAVFLQHCYENSWGDTRRVIALSQFAEIEGSEINIDKYQP